MCGNSSIIQASRTVICICFSTKKLIESPVINAILPPERDYDKERKLRKQRDIELLFDKQAFLNGIKLNRRGQRIAPKR
jgi:hypothetical protein